MTHLTAKELRDSIADLDDDTIICGVGHFGETLSIQTEGSKQLILDDGKTTWRDGKTVNAFILSCEEAGPDPD